MRSGATVLATSSVNLDALNSCRDMAYEIELQDSPVQVNNIECDFRKLRVDNVPNEQTRRSDWTID